jgi:hypothetical protein
MKRSFSSAKRITMRAYTDRMAERRFVKEVLALEVTPEVEAFTAAAAQRSNHARNAAFLDKFRRHAATVAA